MQKQNEHRLHIVLVEPEIPQNTGNIGRTCAAIGAPLHLIHPLGFSISEKSVRRAGLDYWHMLEIIEHKSLAAFMQDVPLTQCVFVTTKGTNTYTDIPIENECYLIFGKETAGLPEDILRANPERCARLPMRKESRSLNLSNTVAIMAYDVLRRWNFDGLQQIGELRFQ